MRIEQPYPWQLRHVGENGEANGLRCNLVVAGGATPMASPTIGINAAAPIGRSIRSTFFLVQIREISQQCVYIPQIGGQELRYDPEFLLACTQNARKSASGTGACIFLWPTHTRSCIQRTFTGNSIRRSLQPPPFFYPYWYTNVTLCPDELIVSFSY